MNPKPKPPMPGGEHTQFIDSGPQGVSSDATRVNLIPVGDGGPGLLLPRPRRKKRRPRSVDELVPHAPLDLTPQLSGSPIEEQTSNQGTAKKAIDILVRKSDGYFKPNAGQRQALILACAKAGKIVYGKAFDVIRFINPLDPPPLDKLGDNLDQIIFVEVKSTRLKGKGDKGFAGHFFSMSTAELLVAQSLGKQFRFVFVDTGSGHHEEMSLQGIFSRARSIYPTWSIRF